jgi:two-component system KDP operon response regulator KdpE
MVEALGRSPCILVVEDRVEVRTLVVKILQGKGYLVQEAEDGELALELLRKGGFDIVLLDILLPRLGGWKLLKEVREFTRIPIVLLTALPTPEVEEQALRYGASGYVKKPFKNDDLLQVVRQALGNHALQKAPAVSIASR